MARHRVTRYLEDQWQGGGYSLKAKKANPPPPLSDIQVSEIERILASDILDYYTAGLISLFDAIRGIQNNSWSWSVVKLYYSVFYFARAYVGVEKYVMAPLGGALGFLKVSPGQVIRKMPDKKVTSHSGDTKKLSGSHGSVLYILESELEHSLLISQEIEGVLPTEWMAQEREFVNYKNTCFCDPLVPGVMEKLSSIGVRRAVTSYLSDDDIMFAFDKDHAILAYPILFMKEVFSKMKDNGIRSGDIDQDKKVMMKALASDSSGNISALHEYFS